MASERHVWQLVGRCTVEIVSSAPMTAARWRHLQRYVDVAIEVASDDEHEDDRDSCEPRGQGGDDNG